MFFMWLFYLAVAVGGCYAIWHFVIREIVEEKERQREEEIARRDELVAEKIARDALLAGDDIQHDLEARVALLEELSAKMQKLTQTAQVADRIAEVRAKIASLKEDIMLADARAHAAEQKGAINVDEDGNAEVPGDDAKITKGGRKVAHAKK